MKRFSNILKDRKGSRDGSPSASSSNGSPESTASAAVKAFCEANTTGSLGDEVTHLPTIVEAAESSPAAAAACAVQLRKFLSVKSNISTPANATKSHIHYNAMMLLRILADNPGPSFTKNIDAKFVDAVKSTLRNSTDPSVQQIVRDTLQTFEVEKAPADNNLLGLVAMWRKEKTSPNSRYAMIESQQAHAMQRAGLPGNRHRSRLLPEPTELAGRIEEARTSAKLLIQLVQSTPASEVPHNDLIKEFADRCQSAQRSMQSYMNATEPHPPDPDTFQTLIETCEQLNVASSKYQRAVLAVRRTGSATPSNPSMSPAISPPPPSIPNMAAIPAQAPVNGAAVTRDPFSDEHQVSYELPATVVSSPNKGAFPPAQAHQLPYRASNSATIAAANSLGATAAQQQAALDAARARKNAQQTTFSPPTGPPPGQSAATDEKAVASSSAQEVADDDDDDLYGPPSSAPMRTQATKMPPAVGSSGSGPPANIPEASNVQATGLGNEDPSSNQGGFADTSIKS